MRLRLNVIRRKKKKEQTNKKNRTIAIPASSRKLKIKISSPGRFKLHVEEPKHPKFLSDEEEFIAMDFKDKKKSRKAKKRDEASGLPTKKRR